MDTALMLPATYSVIGEEEMTYLDGGELFGSIIGGTVSLATGIVTTVVNLAMGVCGFVGSLISAVVSGVLGLPVVGTLVSAVAVVGFGCLVYGAVTGNNLFKTTT